MCRLRKQNICKKITASIHLSVNNRIINEDDTENKEASRRVEFRVITNSEETIDEIIDNYKE